MSAMPFPVKWICIVWAVGVILMNVTLVSLSAFEITFGTLGCSGILIAMASRARIQKAHLAAACGFLAFVALRGMAAESATEYFKSFVQVVVMVAVLLIAFSAEIPLASSGRVLTRFLLMGMAIVAVLVVIQFLLLNVLDVWVLAKPLGQFTARGPGGIPYEPNPLSAFHRPAGIYSEPSVAAWILTFAFAVAVSSPEHRYRPLAMLFALAALCTLTLSAFFNVTIISLVKLVTQKVPFRRRMFHALALVIGVAGLYVVADTAGILSRLDEVDRPGSSAYYRVVAPVMLLEDSLPTFPLGHALGQTNYTETKSYMINWEFGSNTNIDNSFLLIAFYFGFVGVAISVVAVGYLARLVWLRSAAAAVVAAILLALSETGALWSPNVALLIALAIMLVRSMRAIEPDQIPSSVVSGDVKGARVRALYRPSPA